MKFLRALKSRFFDQKTKFFWYFWVTPNGLLCFLRENPPKNFAWNGYRKLPHNLWLFLEDKVSFGKSEIISSNILDISCWPISKMFQHFSDFQCFILSYKNGHKLGLKLHIQIWFSTLYYHESQRKKMEHELGDWKDYRGPKNDRKLRWSCSMHESVLYQKWMFFVKVLKSFRCKISRNGWNKNW